MCCDVLWLCVADGRDSIMNWPERGRDSLAHASSRLDLGKIQEYIQNPKISKYAKYPSQSSRRCGDVNLCGSRHYHVLLHLTDLTSAFHVHSTCIPRAFQVHQIAASHTEAVRSASFHLISSDFWFPMFSIGNQDFIDLRPSLLQTLQ